MRCLVLLIPLLMACGSSSGPKELRVVENESPPSRLESIPITTVSSETGALDPFASDEVGPDDVPVLSGVAPPTDLRSLDPSETAERAKLYESFLLQPIEPEPVGEKTKAWESTAKSEPITRRGSLPRPKPSKPSPKAQEKTKVWNAGNEPLTPRNQGATLHGRYAPGTLYQARLLGDLWVSAHAPLVLATIELEEKTVGIAIGRASLHPYLTDRVLIDIDQLVVDNKSVSGNLIALGLDRSEGLRGSPSRRPWSKILASAGHALLAAFSLNLGVGSGIADIARVNMADQLVSEARQYIDDLDLQRVVYIDRGRSFYLLSISPTSASPTEADKNNPFQSLDRAFDDRARLEETRESAIMNAYDRLNQALTKLGGRPQR